MTHLCRFGIAVILLNLGGALTIGRLKEFSETKQLNVFGEGQHSRISGNGYPSARISEARPTPIGGSHKESALT